MKRRWLIVSACVVVVALLASLAWWRSARPSAAEDELAATLTAILHEDTDAYIFPAWWSDGSTPLRLTSEGDGLLIDEPRTASDLVGRARVDVSLEAPATADPAAVAALPGGEGAPWVAVAFESRQTEMEDKDTTENPLTWTGTDLTTGDRTSGGEPVTLPATLRSNEISPADGPSAIMTADAAVARVEGTDTALVTTSQLGEFTMHRCDPAACEWEEVSVPAGGDPFSIASTGEGLVALTGASADGHTVWYADDADLRWRPLGEIPTGEVVEVLHDGVDGVMVLSRSGDDSDRAYRVRTADASGLEDEVGPFDFPETGTVSAVSEVDGRWYLAGHGPSAARVDLGADPLTPRLWALGEDSWEGVEDDLLGHQPDQSMRVLYVDGEGGLAAVSSSPAQRITMTWTFATVDG
ncbi:hypothetical protein [Nocardiopsis sp. MG754419]|uniref:hypothetical protein n=1 Tax=Nocardiopsis sp. MG754419 TaxID=2259865 RepID=UPI001BAE25CE|nr:hypothetical protein [Nocardiopsis sp. MG754419]